MRKLGLSLLLGSIIMFPGAAFSQEATAPTADDYVCGLTGNCPTAQPDEQQAKYNLDTVKPYGQENPGLTAFRKGDDGAIYRTYSTYARGLDVLNGTYHLLDMTSKGRDEDPKHTMSWVRRHDRY